MARKYRAPEPPPFVPPERISRRRDDDDEDDEGADEGNEDRPIRGEHRAKMMALKALANRISRLTQGERRKLPMDDELQAQMDLLAGADQRPDRRRVLMRAKLLLSEVDPARLEAALAGDTASAVLERRLNLWRARILDGDDATIQSFLELYPAGDRQAIRTCAREARSTGADATSAQVRAAQSRLLDKLRAAAKASDPVAEELEEPEEAGE